MTPGILKKIVPHLLLLSAFALMAVVAFIGFPREVDPYGWSNEQNAMFIALTRIGWAIGCMICFFYYAMDYSPGMKFYMSNPSINILGAIIFPCYLLAPMVYMNMYSTRDEAIYMTMIGNVYLGMGAMFTTIFIAIAYIFLIGNPIENFFNETIRKVTMIHPPKSNELDSLKQVLR